jgi:hypothetical protein
VAGGSVTHSVVALLPFDSSSTITSIQSELYGNVADATNPSLAETTCSVPSVRRPGDYFGAYDWGCMFEVWVDGEVGERTDTISVTIVLADGTELVESAISSVVVTAKLGAIRGVLTDAATGVPIADVYVLVAGPTESAHALTDETGLFRLEGLEPGDYRLIATDHGGGGYAREWWDDATDSDSAGLITVVGGQVRTIEWSLSRGGIIEGTVTDGGTGTPIAGVRAMVLAVSADGSREGFSARTTTAADGTYQITGLHSSDYIVCFSSNDYEKECWDDKRTTGSGIDAIVGDLVAVEVGTVVSAIDAALTSLQPGTATTTSTGSGSGPPST